MENFQKSFLVTKEQIQFLIAILLVALVANPQTPRGINRLSLKKGVSLIWETLDEMKCIVTGFGGYPVRF
jgi:hypothetical protein